MFSVRLRDFIETREHWLFSVVDYYDEEGIRCLLRYVPSPDGEREKDGIRYKKMGFDEAYEFMKREKPEYVKGVMVVPHEDVTTHYKPHDGLMNIIKTDERVKKMVNALPGIELCDMGITGSKLVGLGADTSDVDFLVYGKSWFKARDLLKKAIDEGRIEGIDAEGWKKIYNKRKPELSFDEFYVHEKRKGNRCLLNGALTDLLFVRDWDQIGPRIPIGNDLGTATITATVTNSDFAFDSPAIYEIDNPEISRVLSFTHTYAGQALAGEMIEARGRVEESSDGKVLVVGTSREPKGEWIKSLTLLGQ
ncbi:DNA polymerase subunit beta [Methanocella sp. CWC-04]|uniref:DNA polymerase subunit beta n=1 Tax=Methanooceanicella nereidis TaxID=2052831 RepID=A0AAP2RC70_9EURY|nr:DNA polymerase subunit beta [Methanocella sp. CWC-04]MCD1293597.1 DNA polymerase subunit beta [Methanocella sp. CWC-04]